MRRRTIITFMIAIAAGMSTQAETRFKGTVDTAWTNAANWTAGVPTASLQARLQEAKTADIDSAEVIGGLNFRGNEDLGQSIININSGGSLTSDGSDFDGNNRVGSNGDATLNINNGGSANFSGTGEFEIGQDDPGDAGYVNVYTGGTLTVSQETQLGADSDTLGNLLIDGGSAVFSNVLAVGQASTSTGAITMTSGSLTVVGSRIEMTDNSSAIATFDMSGGTLTHTDDEIQVGRDGHATFTQSGGEINAAGIYVGHLKGSVGTMNMSGGTNTLSSALTLGNQEKDGNASSGTLNMSGGWMDCNNIEVAAEVGTTGTLNLSGSNTYLRASTLKLGDVGVSATSTITASDGEFQIHEIVSDADSATESFHLNGAVLKLRKISGATGYDDAVALIAPGVLTWTNAPVGTGRDPADANLFWTNDVGSVLMVDTNGSHYNYMWAEAEVSKTYSGWAEDCGLSGGEEAEDANPDDDDLDNLAEYALGGNPTDAGDGAGVIPVGSIEGEFYQYVYNRRTDAGDRGITYDLQNVDDLVGGTWTNEYSEVGISAPFTDEAGDEFEAVTNRISTTGQAAEFTNLEITLD